MMILSTGGEILKKAGAQTEPFEELVVRCKAFTEVIQLSKHFLWTKRSVAMFRLPAGAEGMQKSICIWVIA
jgi:hypothetical protein